MDTIPLTTLKTTVKYFSPRFANPLGDRVLREAFPAFNPDASNYDSETWKKIEESNYERQRNIIERIGKKNGVDQAKVFRIKGAGLRRRFAGDYTLLRGSYFSVCNDEHGNDYGTLRQELSAYLLPEVNDRIVVHDLEMPGDADLLNLHVNAPSGFVIDLLHSDEDPNPIVVKLWKAKLIAEMPKKSMRIFMPLDVQEIEVPGVLDLRQLAAQQWLASYLPGGNENLKMPRAEILNNFYEMLPTLMYPDRGGNDLTNSIGFMLRTMKVNGFVFPSARCNVFCEFLDGNLNDFRGFNFLDYRGSGKVFGDITSRVDVSYWNSPDDLGNGITCHLAPDDSPYANSWKFEGVVENMQRNISHFLPAQIELLSFMTHGTDG